jgi:hypothetical protein
MLGAGGLGPRWRFARRGSRRWPRSTAATGAFTAPRSTSRRRRQVPGPVLRLPAGAERRREAAAGPRLRQLAGVRPLFSAGTIAITGKVRLDAFPIPTPGGSGRHDHRPVHTGKTEDVPIVVTAAQFSRDEKSEDLVNVSLTARVTADPTWAGFGGTQPGTTSPADQRPGAVRRHEQGRGPAGPGQRRHAAHRRLGQPRRHRRRGADPARGDHRRRASAVRRDEAAVGGVPARQPRRRRGAGDVGPDRHRRGRRQPAHEHETLDPRSSATQASAAAINATPVTPTRDPLFVQRTETTQELNDGQDAPHRHLRPPVTKEDVEFPGTVTGDDPYDLADRAQITRVHDTATPPADPPRRSASWSSAPPRRSTAASGRRSGRTRT